MSARAWVLVVAAGTLLLGAGCRSANGKDAAPPARAGVVDAAARAEQAPASPADAGGQAPAPPAKEATKGKKHGGAKSPSPTPTPAPRYRCSRTYCDESGRCFSPSPPNCIP